MNIKNNNLLLFLLIVIFGFTLFSSCTKRDLALADNQLQFETGSRGMSVAESNLDINLRLTRAVETDAAVVVVMEPTDGVEYGAKFTTTPAAVNDTIRFNILSGNSSAVINVRKTTGALFYDDDQIKFRIVSTGSPVVIGAQNQFTLSFAEIISTGGTLLGNGGGATFGNKVFFDLSGNSQVTVPRVSWDLGFFSGADYRVILNSSSAMMAKQLDKNDLTQVTIADTVGFSETVKFDQMDPLPDALPYIDYPDGDLYKTAIAEIAANDADNKVYIVNRGIGVGTPAPSRGWQKIRILRNNNGGYTLQYAAIDANTFNSIQIGKNAAFNFNYVSFENGLVSVEPEKDKWDLAWTYFSGVFNFGGIEVPYLFQDVMLQNRNTTIAKVMTADKAYDDFSIADISGLTFITIQNGMGTDWRSGGGPSTSPAVRSDRYYIVKDGADNYYKLRFTGMDQAGERGYPAFQYALLQ